MVLDRRSDIARQLNRIASITWGPNNGAYKSVSQFVRTFDIYRETVFFTDEWQRCIQDRSLKSLFRLDLMFRDVKSLPVPWLRHDAGEPDFWPEVIKCCGSSVAELARLPDPVSMSLGQENVPVRFIGDDVPHREIPPEYSCIDRVDGTCVYERMWQVIKELATEILSYHGYTHPLDLVDSIDDLHFSISDDPPYTGMHVYIFACRPDSLTCAVLIDLHRLIIGFPEWALELRINDGHSVWLTSSGVGLVGNDFSDVADLQELCARSSVMDHSE